MLKRRLQIGKRQSKFDINNNLGFQHQWDKEEILNRIQKVLLHDAHLLKDTPDLYNLLKNKLENQ
jgi:hypothetical protein